MDAIPRGLPEGPALRCVASTLGPRVTFSQKFTADRADLIAAPPEAAGAPGLALHVRRATGARVIDVDGNSYLDLCMGYGAQLLGHDHPAVAQALTEQIAAGWQPGLPDENHIELARLIQAAGPANQRVSFCASGSDAVLLAMRAARAVTGKDVVGVFAGSFHGLHDYGLVSGEPDQAQGFGLTRKVHLGAGIPRAIDQAVSVLPYGHPAAFDLIRRQRAELAAVVVEAVRANDPHLDAGSWLQELQGVCRHAGVLLILDETTTGFRLAYGGAQEVFGLAPDLVTYGKAVGGGLPLGVVAGRADVMRVFAGEAGTPAIFAASGFAGNALSMAASVATLEFAATNRHRLYPYLDARARQLAEGFAVTAADLGLSAAVRRAGSLIRITLGQNYERETPTDLRRHEDRFAALALQQGLLLQAGLRGCLAYAHTPEDVDQMVIDLGAALSELQAEGAR